MEKNQYNRRMLILLVVMALYLFAIISGSQVWGNIASPIVAFIIWYLTWTTSQQREHYQLNWMVVAVLAFSWGLTDTLWMIASNIYGLDPEEMPIFMYLYLIPNILLTSATILYFIKNVKKWYTVQLVLDMIVTFAVTFTFIWNIVLKDYNIFSISYNDIISTFLYLFTDVLSVSFIFVMYFSSKVHKLSKPMKMLIAGICLYMVSDVYYTILVFEDIYVPNSLIDFAYMSAIALLGMASIYESYKPTAVYDPKYYEVPENTGRSSQYSILLLFPTIFYLLGDFPAGILWQLVVIVLIHQVISNYVQGALRNEYLLKKEKQMNENLEDIISERTRDLVLANKALDELSKIDTITGLYNRWYFLQELDKAINTLNNRFSILYMDLDRFKIINDTHGHEMGDQILRAISERLNGWKPEGTLIARLGGDEFAVMVSGYTSCDELGGLCEEIAGLFNKPIVIGAYMFNIGMSIGVSRYPIDAEDRDQLMKYADIAMYHAKKEYGSKRCAIYSPEQSETIEKHNEIEILLRNVDFDKEFVLNFQPQFNISSNNRLIGVEALLRWNSPINGYISPVEFIPIAEETGIILDIGSWVMNKAINQICYWNEKYQLDLVMGINISPKQIDSVDFLPDIKKIMGSIIFDPQWIGFEITESSAMNTNIIMEEILTELSGMGISISIDDFGTGYSSLSYIKRFDIDRLKIAKELIDNISVDQNALLIVKAIVMMAKGMNLITIAEGVETEEQLNILKMLGCDEVQGYILSRPLSGDVFEDRFLAPMSAKVQNG
ncbi:MAG: putative bifunctional diguanylate cyclase/phosphodiesterase [Clostridia bacterium]